MNTITVPIRKTVTVPLQVDEAFDLFTEGFDSWWPRVTHSVYGEDSVACTFESHTGGSIFEVSRDGEVNPWGEVLVWDPPVRLVLGWNPNLGQSVSTEIEVRFIPVNGGTRLELEHRNWEVLGDEAAHTYASYETGWDPVLASFVAAAETRSG
jgi:uncharacterized protein YndB with AHSA1/START domain